MATAPTFKKGEAVVHPEHGVAIVEEIKARELFGEKKTYLKLRVVLKDLTVSVPVESAKEVGLRPVMSKNKARKVMSVLKEEGSPMAANWSRRFKDNVQKIHSGDVLEVAEVVRNLSLQERAKPLSAGEKRTLAEARDMLVSELMYANGVTEEQASTAIDSSFDKVAEKNAADKAAAEKADA